MSIDDVARFGTSKYPRQNTIYFHSRLMFKYMKYGD
jgi:hypothetical protein